MSVLNYMTANRSHGLASKDSGHISLTLKSMPTLLQSHHLPPLGAAGSDSADAVPSYEKRPTSGLPHHSCVGFQLDSFGRECASLLWSWWGGEETFLPDVRAHMPFALWAGSSNPQIFFSFSLLRYPGWLGKKIRFLEGSSTNNTPEFCPKTLEGRSFKI